jgi:hypothetical protein
MGIRPGEFQKTESEKTDSSSGGSDIKKDIPVERK